MTVLFRKHVWRKDKADAQAVADELKLIVNREGDRLVLSTNRDDFKRRNFETDFKIIVPAGTPVLVKNSYGPVKVRETGAAELINPHGRVSARPIGGRLVLEDAMRTSSSDGVQGDCRIDASHGQVIVQNVQGDLLVENTYGSVRAEKVAKKLTISGSHSEITAADLQGPVEIESSYETVRLTRAADGQDPRQPLRYRPGRHQGTGRRDRRSREPDGRGLQGGLKIEGRDFGVPAETSAARKSACRRPIRNVRLLDFTGPLTVSLGTAI